MPCDYRFEEIHMKIVILGCGSVGKCVLYYVPKFFRTSYKNVTVIDKDDTVIKFPAVQECIRKGATFLHVELTVANFEALFENKLRLSKGDLVIDLTTRTPCFRFLKKCRQLNAHYICSSTEEDEGHMDMRSYVQESIWIQHGNVKDIAKKTEHYGNATSMIDFGTNPGLISVFVKQGIRDIAKYVLQRKKFSGLLAAYRAKDYSAMGQLLKVRTIHSSEIDTQVPKNPKTMERYDYLNTWSCVGMIDEASEVTEINVGTHEKKLPFPSKKMSFLSPQAIVVQHPSGDVYFRSYVPTRINPSGEIVFEEIKGCCIHHSENLSLNYFMATDEWSPTMHYVYQPCPTVRKAITKYSKKQLLAIADDPKRWKVLNVYDDMLEGYDNVGATFILEADPISGEKKPWGFWTGSILHTDYTKNVLKDPYFSPTTIQVMAGILSAASWMVKNPAKGVCFAEDVPESFIMTRAKKYLGVFYSGPITGCDIAGYTLPSLIVKKPKKMSNYYGQI